MLFHLSLRSRNEKTGPIPVSTSSGETCPPDCALADACYGKNGHLAMHWAKVTAGLRGVSFDTFCDSVSALPLAQLWRHDQAGDLPGKGNAIDSDMLAQLVVANTGKRGFTYTHKPLSVPGNAAAIAHANANGFTINLSGNNLAHADTLTAAKIGPVVVVVPIEYQRQETGAGKRHEWLETLAAYKARLAELPMATPAGHKLVVCPATYLDDKNCANCSLCARLRDTIVAFPAHGVHKAKASAVATADDAKDPQQAAELAIAETLADWDWSNEQENELHVLGIAKGDIELVEWNDLCNY